MPLDQLPHAVDATVHGLAGLVPKSSHRPYDVVRAGAFLRRDVIVGIHGSDQEGEERAINVEPTHCAGLALRNLLPLLHVNLLLLRLGRT